MTCFCLNDLKASNKEETGGEYLVSASPVRYTCVWETVYMQRRYVI